MLLRRSFVCRQGAVLQVLQSLKEFILRLAWSKRDFRIAA
jgi:hypothetical protein